MRSHLSTITLTLLIILCLCSACVSPFVPAKQAQALQNFTSTVDVGLAPIEIPPDLSSISFSEVRHKFTDSEEYSLNTYQAQTQVLFFKGTDLDNSGNARYWLFGINKGDTYELRIFDRSGWTILPWNAVITADPIVFDTIVSPDVVLNQNGIQRCENATSCDKVQKDIELKKGVYTLTMISAEGEKTLMFNATTGVAIENHD